jgi:hypothetical protein
MLFSHEKNLSVSLYETVFYKFTILSYISQNDFTKTLWKQLQKILINP